MKSINGKILAIFLGVLFIFFAGFIIMNEYTLTYGKKIFLKTVPVDPRDFLRGDYVILNYEIEQDQKVKNFIKENKLKKGDLVYFMLKIDNNKLGSIENILLEKPNNDVLYIKGIYNDPKDWMTTPFDLGIGKYFVPEGRGIEIQRILKGIEVLVSIDKVGNAKIVDLYYKGKKIDFKKENYLID